MFTDASLAEKFQILINQQTARIILKARKITIGPIFLPCPAQAFGILETLGTGLQTQSRINKKLFAKT